MVESSDPPLFVLYNEDDIDAGIESFSKSLIGRILTQKLIHLNSLQNALVGIWCNLKGFRREEISIKMFQFYFEDGDEAERILKGSPWMFRNSWLILKKWSRGQSLESVDFTKTLARVQLWGLPPHCQTQKMGFKIGACLRVVQEFDICENRERGPYVRILVEINNQKPLLTGIHVGSQKDGVSWVDFHYERLPQFCYHCGCIGQDEMCKNFTHIALGEEK
ncbi:Zinc knuckle CX2CX4HX4C [Sesbania bispinosa]|nr:Zinc knuckle CX2CX4HX4C [Sesbania bispinosa]